MFWRWFRRKRKVYVPATNFDLTCRTIIAEIKQEMIDEKFRVYLNNYDFSYLELPPEAPLSEGDHVYTKLNEFPFEKIKVFKFYVSAWKPWTWRHVNTGAFVNKPYGIWIKGSVPLKYWKAMIAHECTHLANFSHGGNYNSGNTGKLYFDSVPQVVQEYFEGIN